MSFYEDQPSLPFYGGQHHRLAHFAPQLPPIVGLGAVAGMEGPLSVNPAIPTFQAAAMTALNHSISPALSSIVLGMSAGNSSIAANALTHLYQQRQVDQNDY